MDQRKRSNGESELKPAWTSRASFEEAAALLSAPGVVSGTFLVVLGPAPSVATISVLLDFSVRQIAVSRRLPRGFCAHNPVTGELEEFTFVREFIQNHRNIFRFNYSPSGIPSLDFADDWCKEYVALSSPTEERGTTGSFALGSSLFGLVTTTYPGTSGGWSIMCDHVAARVFSSRVLMVLADGCGFGGRARAAAIAAAHAFLNFMTVMQFRTFDTENFAKALMCSVQVAHDAVLATAESAEDAGTTTLLGAAVVELDASEPERFALMIVSVGDVKAFVWSKEGRMMDATFANRGNVSDATDPGGRVGPRLEKCMPDLRNLKCFFVPVRPGDTVVLMSDGVHDNFDPETNGLAPSLLSSAIPNGKSWSELKPEDAMLLKSAWGCDFMGRLLLPLGDGLTPESLCTTLANFCVTNTSTSRAFMEQNPHKRLPSDYTLYPESEIVLPEDLITEVASFQPGVLGRFLHFDVVSPSASPPGSPIAHSTSGLASSSSPFASLERRMGADRERFVAFVVREFGPNSREDRMLQLAFALFDYCGLTSEDDRRVRAEQLMEAFLSEGSPLLSDGNLAAQARAAARTLTRTSNSKLSGRSMARSSPLASLFDKTLQRVATIVEQLFQEFERNQQQAGGFFMLATSPSSTNKPISFSSVISGSSVSSSGSNSVSLNTSGMGLLSGGVSSSSSSHHGGAGFDLDLRLPSFEQMLKNNSTRQKVLAVSTSLGYETHLRFLVLERDYRREVLDVQRRRVFAKQIYNHFVSASAPSPVRLSLKVRRALRSVIERSEQPVHLDLFAPAVSEVTEWLEGCFYPQLVANDAFMACCDEYFALEKLNRRLLSAVGANDDKVVLQCLDGGAELDFADSQGFNVLLSAAWMGNYKLCGELLKRGAYVNSESNDGSNLWHVLASGPHSDRPFVWSTELRALLKRVNESAIVRPSTINHNKETALHVAVLSRAPFELIKFLCEKCKCPDIREAKNDKGESAFNYANRTKASAEVCEYLMVRK